MVAVIAGVVSWLWSWLAPRSRLATVLTDDPVGDDLKVHSLPTPPIGGIGIYLGLVPAFALLGDPMLWIAATLALGLGVIDDRFALSPGARLGVEIVIGVSIGLSIDGGLVERVVLAVGTVVLINAVNLLDGLDGLAGGVMAVSSLGLGILTGEILAWALGAALAGFLAFNWHPARLFLGDGGAYLVATVFVGSIAAAEVGAVGMLALLGLSGVVAVDLAVTLARRVRTGRPLFEGDRSHVYDQLMDRGWTVRRVASWSAAVQALVVGAIALGWWIGAGAALAAAVLAGSTMVVAAWSGGFVSAQPAR